MKKIKSLLFIVLGAFGLGFMAPVFALPPDYSDLTEAVDFSTTTTAIMGIFAALAVVYIVIKGGSLILQRIRAS